MKSNFVILLIIICLIVVLLAGLFAADKMGIVDIHSQLANAFGGIPLIGEYFKTEEDKNTGIPEASPLEEENQLLRLQITDLENKAAALEKEKTAAAKEIDEIKQELTELRNYKESKEKLFLEARQMAVYYQEMKPDALIKVMDNLDDETIMMILPLLDSEKVADLLSLMEPQRAALLTRMLLGSNPVVEE